MQGEGPCCGKGKREKKEEQGQEDPHEVGMGIVTSCTTMGPGPPGGCTLIERRMVDQGSAEMHEG